MNTLIVDVFRGETRAVLLSPEGKPTEIRYLEEDAASAGAVYLARVLQVRAQLHAAFVDIGAEKNAFLPLEGISAPKAGEFLLVQGVSAQENEEKGFRVRGNIQLPGRILVYLPKTGKIRCSSKIADPLERERLITLAETVCRENEGAILRTAAEGASLEELQGEIESLRTRYQALLGRAKTELRPGILYRPSAADRILGNYASQQVELIVTNDASLAEELRQAAGNWMPETEIRFFPEEKTLLADAYGIDAAIKKALQRKLWLPSGGYVIADYCEAMTVYDVNSGGSAKGRDPEEAALALNLEAAQEIARHMRLIGLGGIVMIDFIDMQKKESKDAVLREMRERVKDDPGGVTAYAIGPLGVMQLTRKRTGQSLVRVLRTPCRTCGGRGTEPSLTWLEADRERAQMRSALSGTERKDSGSWESDKE